MSRRLIIQCDGCPKQTEGANFAYVAGGWTSQPQVGGTLDLCPECSRAVTNFVITMKAKSASPQPGSS